MVRLVPGVSLSSLPLWHENAEIVLYEIEALWNQNDTLESEMQNIKRMVGMESWDVKLRYRGSGR